MWFGYCKYPSDQRVCKRAVAKKKVPELCNCQDCEKLVYTYKDMEAHETKVHEYGDYYKLYPCGECGFMGSDADEIKDHIGNHRDYRTRRSRHNMEKS